MINVTYFEAMNAFQKLDCTPEERIEIKRIISEMKNGASWKAVKYMLSLAEYPDVINAIEAHMRKTMINVTYFEAQCQNGPHRCLYGIGVRGADTPSGRVSRGANRRAHTHSGARLSEKISEACRIACSPRSGKKNKIMSKIIQKERVGMSGPIVIYGELADKIDERMAPLEEAARLKYRAIAARLDRQYQRETKRQEEIGMNFFRITPIASFTYLATGFT